MSFNAAGASWGQAVAGGPATLESVRSTLFHHLKSPVTPTAEPLFAHQDQLAHLGIRRYGTALYSPSGSPAATFALRPLDGKIIHGLTLLARPSTPQLDDILANLRYMEHLDLMQAHGSAGRNPQERRELSQGKWRQSITLALTHETDWASLIQSDQTQIQVTNPITGETQTVKRSVAYLRSLVHIELMREDSHGIPVLDADLLPYLGPELLGFFLEEVSIRIMSADHNLKQKPSDTLKSQSTFIQQSLASAAQSFPKLMDVADRLLIAYLQEDPIPADKLTNHPYNSIYQAVARYKAYRTASDSQHRKASSDFNFEDALNRLYRFYAPAEN